MGGCSNQFAEMAKGKNAFLLYLQICKISLELGVSLSALAVAIIIFH